MQLEFLSLPASSVFSFCKFWFNPDTASSAFSIPPLTILHKITGLQSSSPDMSLAHSTLPCMPQPGRLHLVNPVTCICVEARLSVKHHCFDLISLTIAREFYLTLNILFWTYYFGFGFRTYCANKGPACCPNWGYNHIVIQNCSNFYAPSEQHLGLLQTVGGIAK